MNKEKLKKAIMILKDKINESGNSSYLNDERIKRKEYYKNISKEKLIGLSREDFFDYFSQLWSLIMWGNKNHIIDKICEENGFDNIKCKLADLLYGEKEIGVRWDDFRTSVKWVGPAAMSELLSYVRPNECAIFNKTTLTAFDYLDVSGMPKYSYQYTGEKYLYVCKKIRIIADALKKETGLYFDLLDTDYFLWDIIRPLAEEHVISPDSIDNNTGINISIHDEVKNKLVNIGEWLGFQSKSEVKVAVGAVVDVVWEVQIGNMGKAIYVFEVQSKGSIDSLIMNLLKSRSNPAVQAIIAVASEEDIATIIKECECIDEVRKNLKTWDMNDVLIVHDSLERAHESINKLKLVPASLVN